MKRESIKSSEWHALSLKAKEVVYRGERIVTYLSVGELESPMMETSQGLYSWNVGVGYCMGRV